jgi:hydroxyacylglutathione hydrolase
VREVRSRVAEDWHQATAAEMTIPSTIGEEKATNPFMRAPTAEELGRLRELKDNF